MTNKRTLTLRIGILILGWGLAACTQTYPRERIRESIQEICRKEYGIEDVRVKIVGKTIGVHLPTKKLFVADFKEALAKGNIKLADMENLFQPAPEALDQIEDVLFSISRVLLSTDFKLDFYTLQATDISETGLQLVLAGYVDDIKRVRLWDISREEYRKRILHELRLNRAVIWHRPVRTFFQALEREPSLKTAEDHLPPPITREFFQSLFFFDPSGSGEKSAQWNLGELRSTQLEAAKVLVYAPVTVTYDPDKTAPGTFSFSPGTSLEYLFIVSFASESSEIIRAIPLSYFDEPGKVRKVKMPGEFDIEKDKESWETEFSPSEIHLGNFLAEQLTRRTQNLLFSDERIRNTFEAIQLHFRYEEEETDRHYFSLDLELKPKTPAPRAPLPTALDEDVLYLLGVASREFVDVLRSYQFANFEFLQLNLASDAVSRIIEKEDLEQFRRNKVDLQGLLVGGIAAF